MLVVSADILQPTTLSSIPRMTESSKQDVHHVIAPSSAAVSQRHNCHRILREGLLCGHLPYKQCLQSALLRKQGQ